jgi:PAS domain S-box-containing protein
MKSRKFRSNLRVVLIYTLFSGLWILISDRLLAFLISDASTITAIQTYKGWFFVAVSALLIFFLLQNETSHRQTAEDKSQESEERYRLLFENSTEAILLTMPDGHILSANPAACQLFERTEQELCQVGRNGMVDLTDPRLEKAIEERSRTGRFRGELTFIRKDGSKFEGDISSLIFKDKDGNVRASMIIRDISERKKAEQALRESENLFSKIFQSSPIGINIFRVSDGRSVVINDAFLSIIGYSRQEVVGHSAAELNLFVDADVRDGWMKKLREGGDVHNQDARIRSKSGEIKNTLASLNVVEIKGEPMIMVITSDITKRKHTEDELRKSEENFSKAFMSSPAALLITRLKDGQYIEFNDAYLDIVGYSRKELIGRKTTEFNIFINTAERQAIVSKLLANGSIRGLETSIRHRSGAIRHVIASQEIIKFNDNEDCILSLFLDITERKMAEAKIQRQLQHINSLHTIDQAIGSNLGLHDTLNVVLQQVISQLEVDVADVLLMDDQHEYLECVALQGFSADATPDLRVKLNESHAGRAIHERTMIHISNLLEADDLPIGSMPVSTDGFIDYYCIPLLVKQEVKGVLEINHHARINPDIDWLAFFETIADQAAIAIDNTQLFEGLQRTNAELEQRVKVRTADLLHMNTELEYANRAKDEFLANMSHELRTPLTNILGLAESMQLSTYGEPNEKQVKALQNIESSGRHLLELINDILDLSKIEAGKFDIYPEEVNIDEICRASLLFIREQAQKKSIMVNYQLLEDVKTVLADPRRLKQILVNLLSNAVKFTPDNGRVTLTVHADAEHGQMHFSVIDSGIGIAQEDLSRLFTPFTQVDSSLNRQYEGTGLGLVLVFRLAEMHRGSVHVESEAGRGSSFTVSLPWLPLGTDQRKTPGADAQVESRAVQPPNSLGTLLLVDDNLANIEAIGDYLQYHGYTVVVASNGLEALVKAEESNPRLILMDIQMPVMDGLESMRRLRADPRFIITPIIALTALAMSGDRERCLEAGATDYLSKPVRLKELAERVKSLLK